jgi:hypothetical protein
VFGFAIEGDKIVSCAPIARRWLLGRTKAQARAELRSRRYRVTEITLPERERAFLALLERTFDAEITT